MKIYCQFKVLSTGYIAGSIPPQFSEDNKRPIDLLGNEGVYILDGRKSIPSLIDDCRLKLDKMRNASVVCFEIIRADSFLDNGKVIFKSEKLF